MAVTAAESPLSMATATSAKTAPISIFASHVI